MSLAALREELTDEVERGGSLCEEVVRAWNGEEIGMARPHASDALVNALRLFCRLDSDRVLRVSLLRGWRAEVDNGCVTQHLLVEVHAGHGGELLRLAGPICDAIKGASIAQRYCDLLLVFYEELKRALHVKDGELGRYAAGNASVPGESALKDDARGFRKDGDVLAERAARELEDSRLSRARPASYRDEDRVV